MSGDGGPRGGLRGRRSEDRLRTPLPCPGLYVASSLWKTLGSVALQARASIDVNTGVWGDRGGVREALKSGQPNGDSAFPVPNGSRAPARVCSLRSCDKPHRRLGLASGLRVR
jgi:hypothetical protein